MSDSSFGNAAPKNRSINVGANLLGEWAAEQKELRREVGICAAIGGGSLLAVLIVLPILWETAAKGAAQNVEGKRQLDALGSALSSAETARKAAQPALVVRTMCDRTTVSFDSFLNEVNRVLAAGNSRTAVANARFEVNGGEAHVLVQADAEEDGAADAFARNAGEEGAKVDAITNSKPSTLLGSQGMTFTYEKRIGVLP